MAMLAPHGSRRYRRFALALAMWGCADCVPAQAQRAAARWSVQREVVIGSRTDGPASLTEVADVAVADDGTMYVLQPQEQLVRVFDRAGRFVRTIGRRGSGPGEFEAPAFLGWRADTLLVVEPYASRIGGIQRNGRAEFLLSYVSLGDALPRAMLADGRVLLSSKIMSDQAALGAVRSDQLTVAARSGRANLPYARLALNHYMMHFHMDTPAGPADAYFPQPFGDGDLYDVDPLGRWTVVLQRPVQERGGTGSMVLTRYSPQGRVVWRVVRRYAPQPLPPALVRDTAAAYAQRFARFQSLSMMPSARIADAIRSAMFMPARLAPATVVLAGRDGSTWVRRSGTGAVATWMVFDETGRQVAYVDIPATVTVHAADRTNVWGTFQDTDDIPFLARFRVVRRAGR